MKKIVHITDLHIGAGECRNRMLSVVASIQASCPPADHVIVLTGDIVDAEDHAVLDDAWNTVLRPLRDAYDFLTVPGNHDCGTGWWAKPAAVADLDSILGPSAYPGIRVDAIAGMTFIGIDSNRERMHWINLPEGNPADHRPDLIDSDALMGWVGEDQRDALTAAIEAANGGPVTVYMHHDPLYHGMAMALGNWHMVKPLIDQNRVMVFLCGHSHCSGNHNGEWDIPHFYNGGTTGGKDQAPDPVRVIDPNSGVVIPVPGT